MITPAGTSFEAIKMTLVTSFGRKLCVCCNAVAFLATLFCHWWYHVRETQMDSCWVDLDDANTTLRHFSAVFFKSCPLSWCFFQPVGKKYMKKPFRHAPSKSSNTNPLHSPPGPLLCLSKHRVRTRLCVNNFNQNFKIAPNCHRFDMHSMPVKNQRNVIMYKIIFSLLVKS